MVAMLLKLVFCFLLAAPLGTTAREILGQAGGIGAGKKCKTTKSFEAATPCATGLYCNSKGVCAKFIAEKKSCLAYLPYDSCADGLYCKPSKPQTKIPSKPVAGTCEKYVPLIYDKPVVVDDDNNFVSFEASPCDPNGPVEQCRTVVNGCLYLDQVNDATLLAVTEALGFENLFSDANKENIMYPYCFAVGDDKRRLA